MLKVFLQFSGGPLPSKSKTVINFPFLHLGHNCSSDNCLPLKTIEEYAEKNNLTLFLIMSSFYNMETSLSQNIESTLFAIKATHYGNINNNKYIQSFKEDIGYNDYVEKKDQKWLGDYIFYKKDSIIDIKINPINAHNNK